MVDLRQLRKLTPGLSVGATTAALTVAIVFVLAVVTTGAAHAQGFQLVYTFSGGLDGGQPYSGLTMNSKGDLFGTTHTGNQGINWGQVYALRRSGSSYTFADLALFDGTLQALRSSARMALSTAPARITCPTTTMAMFLTSAPQRPLFVTASRASGTQV